MVVPGSDVPNLFARYPWLLQPPTEGEPRSWSIHFTQSGLPLYAEPSRTRIERPMLAEVAPEIAQGYYSTNRLLERTERSMRLSRRGLRYIGLLTTGAARLQELELKAEAELPVPELESAPVPEPEPEKTKRKVLGW